MASGTHRPNADGIHCDVSVIVPTYNRAGQLERVISSVAAQSYAPLEVILVDDASSDSTQNEVARLCDVLRDKLRIVYIRHETNLGGGAARNAGTQAANGSLIAFLDSDDIWLPDKLRLQVAAWRNSRDPSHAVVYCQLVTNDGWRKEIRPTTPKAPATPVGDYLFIEGGFVQTSCLLLPKTLALRASFDEDLRAHQDLQLVLSLEEQGAEFIYVDNVLVRYSTAPEQGRVSSNRDPRPSEVFLERYGHLLGERAKVGFQGRYLAMRYGKAGQPLKGSKLLWRAFRSGILPIRDFGWLLFRTVVPEPAEMFIRRTIRRLQQASPSVSGATRE